MPPASRVRSEWASSARRTSTSRSAASPRSASTWCATPASRSRKPSEVKEGDPNSIVSALAACQQLELLTALLDGAGEDLNYGTFTTAGYDLGEIELPGEPEPFFFGPPPHTDGDRPLYRYEFDVDDRQFEPAS